ncbi:MSMEG_0570 family nitrogen starvation response protein [Rhizobium sp. 18055]|jgi:uncharacterized repeat protein (TIGR04042 family)|uniref:MSMEG_0570 family nitrogen starvation response protein n=1 Tax=Rhizobium sp. 18055 TaxID=2681403 RepID=UPI00135C03F3|nr:MSMEG_0570 family nitrogen starvation response protein [Rhizobium sp. 18055]
MPEMRFVIAWPDGREETCYSPSLVIRDFLEEGQTYPIRDFLDRSRKALTIASDRVEAKYGYPCTLARSQLARIEEAGARFISDADAKVRCESFIP